jgi:hypothetical protein
MGKRYSFAILSSSSTLKHVIDNILNRAIAEDIWRIPGGLTAREEWKWKF